jgi:hypothetical protein
MDLKIELLQNFSWRRIALFLLLPEVTTPPICERTAKVRE